MTEVDQEQSTRVVGAQRFQARSAGILALTGTALIIVSNLLQQRGGIPRGDPLAVLDYINGRPWFTAALASILGILCWTIAFVTAGRSMQEPASRAITRIGEPVLLVAAAVFAIGHAHDGFTSGVIALQWASGNRDAATAASEMQTVEGLVGGTSILSQTLLGLALCLYAMALLRSGQYSRMLSWVGVIGALGCFISGSALFLRLPGTSFELLVPFLGLVIVWVLGVGVALLRSSTHGSTVASA